MDLRYVGKPSRYVYTNALLGDAGFLNCVQRGDFHGASGTAWTTHVRASARETLSGLLLSGMDALSVRALVS